MTDVPFSVGLLPDPIVRAWSRFLDQYAAVGGHRYHGWDKAEDPRNYRGPIFWSEADCSFRFAVALEQEFPAQVHLEMPVAGWTFADYQAEVDKRQFVDVVVSDLSEFIENETSQHRFKTHRHTLFVEVKYLPAGCSMTWRYDHVRKVPAIQSDCRRLEKHLERGRCEHALMLVVDDDCLFEDEMVKYDWPTSVSLLIASPRELTRRNGQR